MCPNRLRGRVGFSSLAGAAKAHAGRLLFSLVLWLGVGASSGAIGDLDGNGTIDHRDVFLFALAWGTTGTSIADLDGDGIVAGTDLVGLVEVAQGGVFPFPTATYTPTPTPSPTGTLTPTATPTPTPTGPVYPYYDLEDYRIHPAEINDNRNPRLAIQSDAEMIVLWAARGYYRGKADGILAELIQADGVPLDFIVEVNEGSRGDVAVDRNDEVDLVYATDIDLDGDTDSVIFSLFDPDLRFYSSIGDVRIDWGQTGTADSPAVATFSTNDFLVAWEERAAGDSHVSVFFSIFAPDGKELLARPERANLAAFNARAPGLAMDASNTFMIAWTERDAEIRGLVFRLKTDPGYALEILRDDFPISQFTGGQRRNVRVAAMDDAIGGWAVVWEDFGDHSSGDIYARLYNRNGQPYTNEFKVNDGPSGYAVNPDVTVDVPAERIYFAWTDSREGDNDVVGCVFDLAGARTLDDFRVDTDPGRAHAQRPAVRFDPLGRVVNVFEDQSAGQDIFLNRLAWP